jgi:hypothetical protein
MTRVQTTEIDGPTLGPIQASGTRESATVAFTLDALPEGSWYVHALTNSPLEVPAASLQLDVETLECVCSFENEAPYAVKIVALAVDLED